MPDSTVMAPQYIYHIFSVSWQQARAEGGALGAQAPALFQNYSKVPLSDK